MPKYYRENKLMSRVELPEQPFKGSMFCLPREMIPVMLGALQAIAYNERYPYNASFEGLEAIRGVQYMLMQSCDNGWQQLYALIDTIYNGTVYTNVGTIENPVLSPAIPGSPETPTIPMIQAFGRIEGLIAQGVLGESADSPYPTSDSILPVLIEIRDQEDALDDEEVEELLATLLQIAAAL